MPDQNRFQNITRLLLILLVILTGTLLASCSIPGFSSTSNNTDYRLSVLLPTQVSIQVQAQNPFNSPLSEPLVTKDSSIAKDKATVTGILLSSKNNTPLTDTVVRLAEVYYSDNVQAEEKTGGVYALDNAFSPSAITDSEGHFTFTDIEARDYVLMVGDIFGNWALALNETKEKPEVWSAVERSITDIGEIYVDF